MTAETDDDFELAVRAFALMTLPEKAQVLEEFARLQDPSVADQFFEAVHRVIKSQDSKVTA